MYINNVGNYLPTSGIDIDFESFANDWNNGKLSIVPNGTSVFEKLPYHLKSF